MRSSQQVVDQRRFADLFEIWFAKDHIEGLDGCRRRRQEKKTKERMLIAATDEEIQYPRVRNDGGAPSGIDVHGTEATKFEPFQSKDSGRQQIRAARVVWRVRRALSG